MIVHFASDWSNKPTPGAPGQHELVATVCFCVNGKTKKKLAKGTRLQLRGYKHAESYLQIRGYLQKKYQIDNLEQIKGINFLKDLLIKNIT